MQPASCALPVAAHPEPPLGGPLSAHAEECMTTHGSPGLLLQQYVDHTPAVELKLLGPGVMSPSVPAQRTGEFMIPPPFIPTARGCVRSKSVKSSAFISEVYPPSNQISVRFPKFSQSSVTCWTAMDSNCACVTGTIPGSNPFVPRAECPPTLRKKLLVRL